MQSVVNYDIVRKAAVIGAVILVIFSMISLVLSYRSTQSLFTAFTDPNNIPLERPLPTDGSLPTPQLDPSLDQMMSTMLISSLLSCFTWIIPGLIAGGLYAVWHNRQPAVSPGAVKGGLISGALAAAVGGLLSGLIGLIVAVPLQQQMMGSMAQAFGEGMPFPTFSSGMLVAFSLVSLIFGVVFWAMAGAATGALGGWVSDYFVRPQPSPKRS